MAHVNDVLERASSVEIFSGSLSLSVPDTEAFLRQAGLLRPDIAKEVRAALVHSRAAPGA